MKFAGGQVNNNEPPGISVHHSKYRAGFQRNGITTLLTVILQARKQEKSV